MREGCQSVFWVNRCRPNGSILKTKWFRNHLDFYKLSFLFDCIGFFVDHSYDGWHNIWLSRPWWNYMPFYVYKTPDKNVAYCGKSENSAVSTGSVNWTFVSMIAFQLLTYWDQDKKNGRHFSKNILTCIFLNRIVWNPTKISFKIFPKYIIKNIPAVFQIMAWRRPGDKPLSEPKMVRLSTHICVTRPQWFHMPHTYIFIFPEANAKWNELCRWCVVQMMHCADNALRIRYKSGSKTVLW